MLQKIYNVVVLSVIFFVKSLLVNAALLKFGC